MQPILNFLNRMQRRSWACWALVFSLYFGSSILSAHESWKPFHPPSVQRQEVFAFTQKPAVKYLGNDKFEISFAVKGKCDVTVAVVGPDGKIVRHVASGVLGSNAPKPLQKNALSQVLYWDGKDDLLRYVKEPKKMQVRVSLGLNPTYEKRLGGTSPYNLVSTVWGMAADASGVYVITVHGKGGKMYIRKFDHEGKYVMTVLPPPANLKEDKLKGYGYVEYEPGKKALQGRHIGRAINDYGGLIAFKTGLAGDCQPALANGKLFFCDGGLYGAHPPNPTHLFSIHTDGAMDSLGAEGQVFSPFGFTKFPRLATSPDGKWAYLATGWMAKQPEPLVYRASLKGKANAEPFLGNFKLGKKGKLSIKMGSDNGSFQSASGIACDAQGRIYVADMNNNRIQVFAQEGKYLKTISIPSPRLVQVHQKTGEIYVLHRGKVKGKSADRLTKLGSFDNPKEKFHLKGFSAAMFTLDSWSKVPMIWTGGSSKRRKYEGYAPGRSDYKGVQIYKESGRTWKKVMDFQEMAAKEDGDHYVGRWQGSVYGKVVCDPVRDQLYFGRGIRTSIGGPTVIDMKTGKYLGHQVFSGKIDDIAFDKRGYMHAHLNPGSISGVARLDPSRRAKIPNIAKSSPGDMANPLVYSYEEVPYDYGMMPGAGSKKSQWEGLIPVKDQLGAKHFQDGIGVNMRGDVAEQANIFYVPKLGKEGFKIAESAALERAKVGLYVNRTNTYDHFMKTIQTQMEKGKEFYSILRRPGIPLAGATIWTFNATGELRDECAVVAGDLINGVQIDEDGELYYVNARIRTQDDKGTAFLAGKAGRFGEETTKRDQRNPLTGTLVKTRAKNAYLVGASAPVPMEPLPSRPVELLAVNFAKDSYGKGSDCWVEGARWLYAGVTPIVFVGCSCPTMRFHTDWFKRTFVPEAYRHSIGVLDTNGNLILHIGRYGNFDSGIGSKSNISVGGDGIAVNFPRFISGTDDRLVFLDRQARIVVLKLGYHAEESVSITVASE